MNATIFTTIIGGLLGGGIIGFIEFLIRRKDAKDDRNAEIIAAIKDLDAKVDDGFARLDAKIKDVEEKVDERSAITARVRILRFSDEMGEGRRHSKDSFDQALSDIDYYEKYCSDNPSFPNNKTVATIEHIKNNYAERLEKHDFL